MTFFSLKDWRNSPDTSTPISAEALEDMEARFLAGVEFLADIVGGSQAGLWKRPDATLALTVGSRAYGRRFVAPRDITINGIAFAVTVAGTTDDACDAGLYNAATGTTLTRLASAGATTGKMNSTGVKTLSFTPVVLAAGTVFYAAFSRGTQGGTGPTVLAESAAGVDGWRLLGTAAPVVEAWSATTTPHPLPTTIDISGAGSTSVLALSLIEA